jgi:hypothetical protein
MKRKTFNPKQMGLYSIVDGVIAAMDDESKVALLETPSDYSMSQVFPRWIRNSFGLWEHGTFRCVDDIITEYLAGRIKSELLDSNAIVHPRLPFDINNTKPKSIGVDRSLDHPDNCTGVIIEVVKQRVLDGR